MNIPQQNREDDKKTLTKEEIHRRNKENEQKLHSHENPNPGQNHEHNPEHEGIGRK